MRRRAPPEWGLGKQYFFKFATMRVGFVTFVQGVLVRVKCRVKNVNNFTQTNFALKSDVFSIIFQLIM